MSQITKKPDAPTLAVRVSGLTKSFGQVPRCVGST